MACQQRNEESFGDDALPPSTFAAREIAFPLAPIEPFVPFILDEECDESDEISPSNASAEEENRENPALNPHDETDADDIERQSSQTQAKPHYQGHRQRLRERFLRDGGRAMPDYEFLELLLFRSIPRRDTKPIAKALLAEFGTLGDIFAADISRLQQVEGCGETAAIDLKIIGAAGARILRSSLPKRNIFTSWDRLIDYCRSAMAYEKREQFRVLFLDKKNGLIADEVLQTGTVDHTPVYPRDVVKRVLDLNASSVILVHNHPSGDVTPSKQDIDMTAKLREITEAMGITIHDHLIIGRGNHASFRELKLL